MRKLSPLRLLVLVVAASTLASALAIMLLSRLHDRSIARLTIPLKK